MNRYVEIAAPEDLQTWLDCLWVRETSAKEPHIVLPDGCIDILFEREGALAGTSSVVGMMTCPVKVRRDSKMNILAGRFRPGGAAAFFHDSLSDLTDTAAPLHDLWRHSQAVSERVTSCECTSEAIELLVTELRARLAPPSSSRLQMCEAAIAYIRTEPRLRIEEVCAKVGVSRQALSAAFRDYVGLSPKLLARVLRIQHVLRVATQKSVSWADLAQDVGCYDQSHLINEFQALTGKTPVAVIAERCGFPNFQDMSAYDVQESDHDKNDLRCRHDTLGRRNGIAGTELK